MRLGLLCLLAVATACQSRGDPRFYGSVVPKHGPNEIWTNNSTEPEWIDPGKCADSAGTVIVRNLFAGLTQQHPRTLEAVPDLAEGWDVSSDGRVYSFHIRGAVWSDGAPLTAHDFEFSWKRVLDPTTGSKYASYLWFVKNGEPFTSRAVWAYGFDADATPESTRAIASAFAPIDRVEPGTDLQGIPGFFLYVGGEDGARPARRAELVAGLAEVEGVHARVADAELVAAVATDAHTFEITLNSPIPYLLDALAYNPARPVPKHLLERLARAGTNPDLWVRPEHIISSGPYLLTEWKFREEMVLEANPLYWDAGQVKNERVRLLMVENYNTTLNLYAAGDLDMVGANSKLPNEFVSHLRQYQDFHSDPWLAMYWYWFNVEREPFDDVRVRRAFSLAIDRASLTRHVTGGGEIPMAGFVPDGLAGYRANQRPLFDPERARALLDEAGYPGGQGLPEITLTYNTSEGHKQIAEAVQQMWKTHLGVHVALENQEWNVMLKNMHLKNFQMARLGWVGDYPDPYTFLELFSSGNGNNHSGWHSRAYDRALAHANREQDRQARLAALRQAEELLVDGLPAIPIYSYVRNDMWKPYLKGMWPNFQNNHDFKWMWIDPRWYDGVPSDPGDNPEPTFPPPISRK